MIFGLAITGTGTARHANPGLLLRRAAPFWACATTTGSSLRLGVVVVNVIRSHKERRAEPMGVLGQPEFRDAHRSVHRSEAFHTRRDEVWIRLDHLFFFRRSSALLLRGSYLARIRQVVSYLSVFAVLKVCFTVPCSRRIIM